MKLDEWKRLCPYGKWTCADGREVLFNRQYWPILERCPGATRGQIADPNERVPWVNQHHFFDDSESPWSRTAGFWGRATLERVNAVLVDWGFAPLPKPPKPSASKRLPYVDLAAPIKPRSNPWQERTDAASPR